MHIHIRSRAGLVLDLTNEAASVPDFDNRPEGAWFNFKIFRPPIMRVDAQGSLLFVDEFDPRFGFSVTRRVFKNAMNRAFMAYQRTNEFHGHTVFFQRRHPERRIFVPRDIVSHVQETGLSAYAKYDDKHSRKIVPLLRHL